MDISELGTTEELSVVRALWPRLSVPEMQPRHVLLLTYVLVYNMRHGTFPTLGEIAKRLGLVESVVVSLIRWLERHGVVTRVAGQKRLVLFSGLRWLPVPSDRQMACWEVLKPIVGESQ